MTLDLDIIRNGMRYRPDPVKLALVAEVEKLRTVLGNVLALTSKKQDFWSDDDHAEINEARAALGDK